MWSKKHIYIYSKIYILTLELAYKQWENTLVANKILLGVGDKGQIRTLRPQYFYNPD